MRPMAGQRERQSPVKMTLTRLSLPFTLPNRTCPSRRHLFLGQMLLLVLFLSSVMRIAFVPNSNRLTCTLIRAGVGICFAIVYGTLLVKTVFLLSLHTGVYLSAEYQALLLFFIISTQV